MSELVLASGSPQRRAILTTLGVEHRVVVPGVDELTDGDPVAVAVQNALLKARAVARDQPAGTLILGSDTVIVDRTADAPRAVGKPADAAEAATMLRRWSGDGHHVASSAAVVRAGGPDGADEVLLADAALTLVRFRALSDDDVAWYVGTGEWEGRAGGYAIQLRGALLVDGIEGDWWTVVGLPVGLIVRAVPGLLRS
ncbi:Maf family protein [Patulibacter minatonensis]|uniref:Maf family protein n=1 Tax=Patulibacter minatonensis TaxID=298163 RepID=UPI00047E8BF4|nr:Maf family protein [Patulibacter minatonensis]